MSTSPSSKPRKWASVRKKFNLIAAHRASSPDRTPSPSGTLSAESQAASFCRPYTANPSSSSTSTTTATTTIEAPPRSPRPVSSPMAFPVHLPPSTPTPTPTPPPPPPPPPPPAPKAEREARRAAKLAQLAGDVDPTLSAAEAAQLAPATPAEREWDRLTKANSELNNALGQYSGGSERRGMRQRAKSRVRRRKGVRFCDAEDVIGIGGFEVWTTDEESGGEEEEQEEEVQQGEKVQVRVRVEREEREREKVVPQRVEVTVTAPRPPPPPLPVRPQSMPASARRAPPQVPVQALGHPTPKRPPPPPQPQQQQQQLSEKREVSRKMLPPSVRLVQDDGSF